MANPYTAALAFQEAYGLYEFIDGFGEPTPEDLILEQLQALSDLVTEVLAEVEATRREIVQTELSAIQSQIDDAALDYHRYLKTGDSTNGDVAVTGSGAALTALLNYASVGSIEKAALLPMVTAAVALRVRVINDIENGDTSYTHKQELLDAQTFIDDFADTLQDEVNANVLLQYRGSRFEEVTDPVTYYGTTYSGGDLEFLEYTVYPQGWISDDSLVQTFEIIRHRAETEPFFPAGPDWSYASPFSLAELAQWANVNNRQDIVLNTIYPVQDLAYDVFGGNDFEAISDRLGDLTNGTYHRDGGASGPTDTHTVAFSTQGVVFGIGGDDTITGNTGNDVLFGDDANEKDEFGGDLPFGNDELRGLDGNDNLFGGAGNDLLLGGIGRNRLEGGSGDDTVSYADLTAGVTALLTVNIFQDTGQSIDWIKSVENLTGSNFDDHLTGNGFGNILSGLDGADTLKGLQGEDTLLGGNGNDSLKGGNDEDLLRGGAGRDTLRGGNGDDTLIGGDANNDEGDYLFGGAGIDTALFEGSTSVFLDINDLAYGSQSNGSLSGIENITTGSGWDNLQGSSVANHFITGDGNDNLMGRGGDDTLDGGDGFDTVSFWENTTGITVDLDNTGAQNTGDGLDTILNVEAVWGGTGNDLIKGTSGGESFLGRDGDDIFEVVQGFRNLDGGTGFDTVRFLDNTNTGVNLSYSQIAAGGAYDLFTSIEAVETGTGNDTLFGDDFANRLSSGGGNDTLRAGLGDDTIDGGAGIDLLTYEGSSADITVDLSNSAAQATGEGLLTVTGVENVYGGDGNDSLTGDAGNNVLFGDDGNDTLNGGLGNDTLNGGLGSEIDTASYAGLSVNVTVDLRLQNGQTQNTGAGVDYLYGIENLTGGNGNDLLIGTSADNALSGGLGNDTLNGGLGDDTLDGGAGFDFARFETVLGLTIDLANTGAQNVGNGVDTFISIEGLQTGTGNDTIYGTTGADHIVSGGGNDIIFGRGGNDTLDAGDGFDVINFSDLTSDVTIDLSIGGGVDTGVGVMTLLNGEFFATGSGHDMLIGDAGNTAFSGGAGNDTMIGGLGEDSFYGSTGIDLVSFAHMTTAVTVDLSNNSTSQNTGEGTDYFFDIENVEAGSGNDALSGGFGDNHLSGGLGNDTLTAGPSGVDTLDGGGGDDVLTGSGVLIGGAGDDTLNGGGSATAMFTGSVAVTVDLGLSTAQNTGHGIDTLLNVRHATGGDGNDLLISSGEQYTRLTGGAGDDTLRAEGGDTLPFGFGYDTLEGGAGSDTAEFLDTFDATIDLGIVGDQFFGHRIVSLIDIESITTDGGNDSLTGTDAANYLSGGADNDTLNGGLGNDTLDGGTGIDTALFLGSTDTTVDLRIAAAQNTGHGLDTVLNIENVIAGSGNDVLTGDASDNEVTGGLGDDTLDGGAGNDTLIFEGSTAVAVDLNITGAQNTGHGVDTILNFENIQGSHGSSTLIGNDGANRIIGGVNHDTITGGLGDDTLDGFGGSDTALFYGTVDVSVDLNVTAAQNTGHGFDVIRNIDHISSGSGNDTLTGDNGRNTLFSGDGDDMLYGGLGNDMLAGGNDDDTLSGGDGNDTYNGGAGIDLISFAHMTTSVTVDLGNLSTQDTGEGLDYIYFVENVLGGNADDVLSGRANYENELLGGAGHDTLNAGSESYSHQADTLDGGSGNDVLNGGAGNVILIGGAGNDTINGGTQAANRSSTAVFEGAIDTTVDLGITAAQNTGHGFDTLLNIQRVETGSGNDLLLGDSNANSLLSGEGSDTVSGGLGNDTLDGGAGFDMVQFLGSTDTTLVLGSVADQETGHGLDQIINFEAVVTGSGTDHLTGSSEDNLFKSGAGKDTVLGNDGDDTVFGNSGYDSIEGNSGNDSLMGGKGNDTIYGGRNRDELEGNSGNDQLFGGSFSDWLNGGKGDDKLVGGSGSDDFIFKSGDGDDTIEDFDATNNKEDIKLADVLEIVDFADLAANHMQQIGNDVVIDDGDNLTITLLNVDLGDLGKSDFIF
ncbi:beta strand repeat-containing protein [Planktotalea sp.]|uniref:beta strand repeat-containing protein n=1 Tax=Planktotalea sp. TaxID=2029877 RepID=UPI003D6AF812